MKQIYNDMILVKTQHEAANKIHVLTVESNQEYILGSNRSLRPYVGIYANGRVIRATRISSSAILFVLHRIAVQAALLEQRFCLHCECMSIKNCVKSLLVQGPHLLKHFCFSVLYMDLAGRSFSVRSRLLNKTD